MTADWGQFCRFSGLKCRPKLVGMFNTFIRTKFNVFGTFENFDLMGLVLTKGVNYYSTCSILLYRYQVFIVSEVSNIPPPILQSSPRTVSA